MTVFLILLSFIVAALVVLTVIERVGARRARRARPTDQAEVRTNQGRVIRPGPKGQWTEWDDALRSIEAALGYSTTDEAIEKFREQGL